MSVFAIAGVTGHVGSVAGNELLGQGQRIKAIVRDPSRGAAWQERGAEIATGSLDDPQFLSAALTGADGFFAMLPPDVPGDDFFGARRRMSDAIAAAVQRSSVPFVVMLSSLGAELPEGTGPIRSLHYLENALRATGAKLVAIRASYFQENIAGVIPAARGMGIYPNFLPSADTAIPMIATRDIGRLAAQILQSQPARSEIVDLLGPAYSARQLSRKLSAALGRPLQIFDIPAAARVGAMVQAGLPQPLAEVYAEMYGALGSGIIAPKGDRMAEGTTTIDEVLPALLARAAS